MDPKNYTVHEDGSKVPTLDYIAECLQKMRDGDQEYIDSLIKVDWNTDEGIYKPVD